MATFGRTERKPRDAGTQADEPGNGVPGPVQQQFEETITKPEDDGIAGDKHMNDLNDVLPPDLRDDKPATGDKPARAYTRVDLSAFTTDMLESQPLEEAELAAPPAETEVKPRSELQAKVDAQFADAYIGWESAGKPKEVRDIYAHDRATLAKYRAAGEEAPVTQLIARRFFLDPAQEAGFRKLLRDAAEFHGKSVKILPIAVHTSGRHMLVWFARDKREKKSSATASTPAA